MPFGWHCFGLETALGEAGTGANKKEEEVAMGCLCECEGWFNLGSRMGQSVGKGTEEERNQRTQALCCKRFMVRSDGNKVTVSADPSCF